MFSFADKITWKQYHINNKTKCTKCHKFDLETNDAYCVPNHVKNEKVAVDSEWEFMYGWNKEGIGYECYQPMAFWGKEENKIKL